jgi:Protein of unknown function (DUF3341)
VSTMLLAEFAHTHTLREAAEMASQRRYKLIDAFTPFPVEGVAEMLDSVGRVSPIGLREARPDGRLRHNPPGRRVADYANANPPYPPSKVRIFMFAGGVLIAAMALGGEYFTAVFNYPYNAGGRPLNSWPAFMLVPFATGILGASIAGFSRFLFETGLPRLHYPLFAVEGIERASQDRFFLAIEAPETEDEKRNAVDSLRGAGALTVREVCS